MTDHDPKLAIDRDADQAAAVPTEDPPPDGLRSADSVVVVNTGDGKGKSTSAFGMMVRGVAVAGRSRSCNSSSPAIGRSARRRSAASSASSGMRSATASPGIPTTSTNDHAHGARRGGRKPPRSCGGRAPARDLRRDDLSHSFGWIAIDDVVETLAARPRHVNVVFTGRDAAPELLELADTVTEMREVKHAYQQGIRAMRGIDY